MRSVNDYLLIRGPSILQISKRVPKKPRAIYRHAHTRTCANARLLAHTDIRTRAHTRKHTHVSHTCACMHTRTKAHANISQNIHTRARVRAFMARTRTCSHTCVCTNRAIRSGWAAGGRGSCLSVTFSNNGWEGSEFQMLRVT